MTCSQSLRSLFCVAMALTFTGCSSNPPPLSAPSVERMGFEDARATFAARGVQPGQRLPALSLVNLESKSTALKVIQGDRPLVLVTASLTCNVARRQQPQVDALRKKFGDAIAVVTIYTIDAHPKGDSCPYTGKEWVPKDNERDQVLVRQPKSMMQRLKLAREFSIRFAKTDSSGTGTMILVDRMDNVAWNALGQAPNVGLLVDRNGIVQLRQGWFDAKAMETAVAQMLGQ